jgi:hypothetical protein
VGEQRVGSQGAIHPELEPDLGGTLGEVLDDRRSPLGPAELLRIGVGDGAGDAGCRGRVQLVRPVADVEVDGDALGGELRFGLGQPRCELALADVAPRADDVGPHLDGHRRSG